MKEKINLLSIRKKINQKDTSSKLRQEETKMIKGGCGVTNKFAACRS